VRCFVVAGFLLTSASRGPSAIAELLVETDTVGGVIRYPNAVKPAVNGRSQTVPKHDFGHFLSSDKFTDRTDRLARRDFLLVFYSELGCICGTVIEFARNEAHH